MALKIIFHLIYVQHIERKEHMLSNNTTYFRLIYFIEQDNNDCKFRLIYFIEQDNNDCKFQLISFIDQDNNDCKFEEDFMFKVIKFNNRHNESN